MPVVPRVEGPSVRQAGLPGARVNSQLDYGAAAAPAAAVGELASVARNYALRAKESADLTALMEAQRSLNDLESDWFRPDNPQGISAYKGKQALAARDTFIPAFDKRVDEIRKGLSRDQWSRFQSIAGGSREALDRRLLNYSSREVEEYQDAEFAATKQSLVDQVVATGMTGDVGRTAARIGDLVDLNRAYLMTMGASEALIKEQEGSLVSGAHGQIVSNLTTANPVAARAWLDRYADQMTPNDYAQAERLVYPTWLDNKAYRNAIAIMGGAGLPDDGFDGESDGQPAGQPGKGVRATIERAADRYGVPRSLALAMAEQESGFDPKAKGPKTNYGQAGGLFQYLESTARSLGIDRFDPEQSADAAMKQLAEQAKERGWEWAIAHHHAGPDPKLHGPKTRDYVDAVKAKSRRYSGSTAGTGAQPDAQMALERAQRIEDPRERKATIDYLDDLQRARKAAQEAQEQAQSLAIYDKVTQASPAMPLSRVLTPVELAFAGRNESLNASINRYRKLRADGQVIDDDPVTLDQLYRLQVRDPNAFRQIRLTEYADRLSGKTLKELVNQQKDIANDKPRTDFATEQQLIDSEFGKLGIQDKDDAAQARGQYQKAWLLMKQQFIQNQGKAPTAEQTLSMLRSLTREHAGRALYERLDYESVKPISADARAAIVDTLRRRGIANPTELQILGTYAEAHKNAQ